MPILLSKQHVLDELKREHQHGECIMCRALKNNEYILEETKEVIVFLSRYPRFWGHTLVVLKKHKERFTELSETEEKTLQELTYKYAKQIERVLKPSRCYTASLGAEQNLINTCPHIHINLIPVYDKNLRPSEVFTWENGLFSGTKEEWKILYNSLK